MDTVTAQLLGQNPLAREFIRTHYPFGLHSGNMVGLLNILAHINHYNSPAQLSEQAEASLFPPPAPTPNTLERQGIMGMNTDMGTDTTVPWSSPSFSFTNPGPAGFGNPTPAGFSNPTPAGFSNPTPAAVPQPVLTVHQLVKTLNQTGLNLFQMAISSEGGQYGNYVLCTHSVITLLLMFAQGASGETHDRLLGALGNTGDILSCFLDSLKAESGGVGGAAFNSVNYILLDTALNAKNDFLNSPILRNNGAKIRFVAFSHTQRCTEAIRTVNQEVYHHTHSMINSVLDRDMILPSTSFVMCNACYFKGDWLTQFDSTYGLFTTPGSQRSVPMIKKTSKGSRVDSEGMGYVCHNNWQGVSIPYQGRRYEAIVLLPPEHTTPADIDSPTLEGLLNNMAPFTQELVLMMPKFKLSQTIDLKTTLGFPSGILANPDLSRLTDKRPFTVDFVQHKVVMETDEEGTRFAAATSMGGSLGPAPQQKLVYVNRPYLFIVREKDSGMIMSIAQISDPKTKISDD
ncbi:serpin family protein [Sansalvadorimonas verongulae]|uniref:serpin family protein n=1 Tax=Sansalvadorimonas verongulae TaxID=2172824 RepID=UPI0018AD1CE9|nr:serpin family protein [Sansalvadorimonas verongulae]